MKLEQIVTTIGLDALTPASAGQVQAEITRAHASDLLSDVLANAPAGGVLLTIQVHLNVIAVALHAMQAAVIFTSGMTPEEAVRNKAIEENIPLFATKDSTFDAAGKLYALGIRGRDERTA
jgi:predicted transcriptional regulator